MKINITTTTTTTNNNNNNNYNNNNINNNINTINKITQKYFHHLLTQRHPTKKKDQIKKMIKNLVIKKEIFLFHTMLYM